MKLNNKISSLLYKHTNYSCSQRNSLLDTFVIEPNIILYSTFFILLCRVIISFHNDSIIDSMAQCSNFKN